MPEINLSNDNINKILEILGKEREQAHSASDIIKVNELSSLIDDFHKGARPASKKTKILEGGD